MADKMNAESAQCDTAKSLSENSREATPAKSSPEQNVETMGETSAILSRSKKDKIDDKEQQPLESSKNRLKPKDKDSRDKIEQGESKVTTPKKDKSYRNRIVSSSESDDERVEQQRSKSPAHSKTRTSGSNGTPRTQRRENSSATSRKRSRSRSRERSRDRHRRYSQEHSSKRLRVEHSDERSRTYPSKSRDTHQSPWKEKANSSSENTSSPSPRKSQETLNSKEVKKTPQKTKNESKITNLSQKGTPPKKEVEKKSRFSPIFFCKPVKMEVSRSWRKEDSVRLLKQDWKYDKREHFCFFFGKESPFSNFHFAQFTVDGDTYSCSEQFMMHQKAVLFQDPFHAEQILKAKDPRQMKRFGRKVQNFNADIWHAKSEKIVGKGIKAKFMQNKHLKRDLINTFPRILVEASPRDRLWGIGMGEKNYKAQSRHTWRGKNRLGYLLTNIRNEIMDEEGLFH